MYPPSERELFGSKPGRRILGWRELELSKPTEVRDDLDGVVEDLQHLLSSVLMDLCEYGTTARKVPEV